jgi:uncharacterized membrane protein
MRTRLLAIGPLAIVTAGCAALALATPSGSPERVFAALLVVLILPGYALSELLPSVGGRTAGERILLIPALSLTAVILDSAALNAAQVRLDLDSWIVSLTAITLLCGAAGGLGRRRPMRLRRLHPPWASARPLLIAVPLVAALLVGVSLVTVNSVSRRQRSDRFTQLWALPAPAPSDVAQIGVYNHEGRSLSYLLRVFSGQHMLRSETVLVASLRTWTTTQRRLPSASELRISVSTSGSSAPVYRWVELHFPGQHGS